MTMRSRRCNPKRVHSFDERDYIDGKPTSTTNKAGAITSTCIKHGGLQTEHPEATRLERAAGL